MKIQEYIKDQLVYLTSQELADKLGVSVSMISLYKKSYNPSLEVATRIYKEDRLALYPFAEDALKQEVTKRVK